MGHLGQFSIALLCSLVALAASFYCGSLVLMVLDPHYHDGVAAVGGLIIGLVVAVFVFRATWRRLRA